MANMAIAVNLAGQSDTGVRAIGGLSPMGNSSREESSVGHDFESFLIQRVLAGDMAVFYELIRPYERLVYLTALSVLKVEADAEEVSQEALLKCFRNLKSFRGECKFSTWLVQIVINEGRMRLRKDRRGLQVSLDEPRENGDGDSIPQDFADWREIPSETLERQEVREALQSAIASLPDKYREVVMMRDVNRLSIRDTANALKIGEANVKTRLLRARLMLRDLLRDFGPRAMDSARDG